MTLVAGTIHQGAVYMMGDRHREHSDKKLTIHLRRPKVFKVGEICIGVAGQPRVGQLIQWDMNVPGMPDRDSDVEGWVATHFTRALYKCMKDNDVHMEKGYLNSDVMIGLRGQLFRVDGEFHYTVSTDDYLAVGSGTPFAVGALYATKNTDMDPVDRLNMAMHAAEHNSYTVCGPFDVISSRF